MQNSRMTRFKKVEKIIKLQQKNLGFRLDELKNLIEKKKQSIAVVEKYLSEYEEQFNQINHISVPNLQNFQSFLNQIVLVLNQERESLQQLNIKREDLFADYLNSENRIELIKKYYTK
ncbi:hypothetical protein EP47_04990 [Legionella norrlandica]|uniref:Flagellar FliJ protein n=1 Tax=Legionella norrlandica TaxID=1498499 RepID=A0A0A2SVF8_9GAMM|nr:hypothetical protein [Legionella norrlandica]KGP63721.1 hypothetical protein EP47_04990 [Legionella norrlandica]